MNLKYQLVFNEEGYTDKNLLKLIYLANSGNDNHDLIEHYANQISKESFIKESLFRDKEKFEPFLLKFLNTIYQTAQYNAIFNEIERAKKDYIGKDFSRQDTQLSNKVSLISEMIADYEHKFPTLKINKPKQKEIEDLIFNHS